MAQGHSSILPAYTRPCKETKEGEEPKLITDLQSTAVWLQCPALCLRHSQAALSDLSPRSVAKNSWCLPAVPSARARTASLLHTQPDPLTAAAAGCWSRSPEHLPCPRSGQPEHLSEAHSRSPALWRSSKLRQWVNCPHYHSQRYHTNAFKISHWEPLPLLPPRAGSERLTHWQRWKSLIRNLTLHRERSCPQQDPPAGSRSRP